MSNDSDCINDNNGIPSTLGNQSACYWPSFWTDPNSTSLGMCQFRHKSMLRYF
ncbi:hypothetical protein BPOR_1301g00010 [Botrytis porri]|uniref:Uncharacterized protein n=1 Tax=Botrytis porri TaxID=87229 RepID=A0A4Z1KAI9_9HELO|nr:hypothetical protein BPOR_1301g00010 [Botrytis porri]